VDRPRAYRDLLLAKTYTWVCTLCGPTSGIIVRCREFGARDSWSSIRFSTGHERFIEEVNDALGLPNVKAMGFVMCLHAEEETKIAKILHSKNLLQLSDDGVQCSGIGSCD
jgi:hypothetical protein